MRKKSRNILYKIKNLIFISFIKPMMLPKSLLLTLWIFIMSLTAITSANQSKQNWVSFESKPTLLVDTIIDRANHDHRIQQTALNNISDNQGSYPKKYKITNTLAWIRANIQPYMQRMLFIGLSFATILLIWNGLRMVTDSAIGGGDIKTAKENIKNILTGVIILTSFVIIIKLVMALINMFFAQ